MAQLLYNKKGVFNYEIVEKLSAGIQLQGFEVKALKAKKGGSLDGSYIITRGGEVFLSGAHIPEYQVGNTPKGYNSRQERKLLLTKKEIEEIMETLGTKGLTVIPISLYNKGPKIKADIAIVRGKKQYDKRESIKKRDVMRDVAREYKLR